MPAYTQGVQPHQRREQLTSRIDAIYIAVVLRDMRSCNILCGFPS
jgi:hypothetical protein